MNCNHINTSKIVPRMFGGLGNQLFIYAAARRLAVINNSELVLDSVSGFARDFNYKRGYQLDKFEIPCRTATAIERLEPFSLIRRYLKRGWNSRLPYERRSYIHQDGMDFDSRLLDFKPQDILYLDGYWQSENYFKDIEEIIRQDLRIREPLDYENIALTNSIRKHMAVSVHVRFFDKPSIIDENNVADDYYHRAVMAMENRVLGAHYYIFSDQPDAARLKIPLPDSRVTLVSHNHGDSMAYADLWLMTQCQHFIIANSTFSWWGAWLAKNCHKQVISPKFEKRNGVSSWGFKGLLPDNWIKV